MLIRLIFLLQVFALEINNKKENENQVVGHLLRLEVNACTLEQAGHHKNISLLIVINTTLCIDAAAM